IPLFAEQVHRYIEDQQLQQVNIFGYSMGGYVAMYLAKMYPQSVHKVITLATKFHWDEETAAKELRQSDPEKIAAKVPAFAEALQKRHAPNDWKELLQRTGSMLEALGKSNTLQPGDYGSIETPCLVLLGDRDKMITLEETLNVYRSLPKAEMGILPGTAHPIEQANKIVLSSMIRYFLQ
ncbi:MAG TPA: alpha/beta fold hydrolase, partial [Chitinophagaceae bacterium]|nr:alpha/beta fold hydrolase [Chitinophagaceae bacterium]